MMAEGWRPLLVALAIVAVSATALGLLGLALIHRSLRRINLPPRASFAATLRRVPLALVVILDLLDLGLDIFATPIVWVVLTRYRLQALRNVAAVEAIIPFTQFIPTLTVAWIAVRLLGLGEAEVLDMDEIEPGRYEQRAGRRS